MIDIFADGNPIVFYKAGKYLTLQAEIPGETYTHIRHYSLSDAPGKDYYRISVKREEGRGGAPAGIVSTYLHQQVHKGKRAAKIKIGILSRQDGLKPLQVNITFLIKV